MLELFILSIAFDSNEKEIVKVFWEVFLFCQQIGKSILDIFHNNQMRAVPKFYTW